MCYDLYLSDGAAVGPLGPDVDQRSRTVRSDWFRFGFRQRCDQAIPALPQRTWKALQRCILRVALDEALALSEREQFTISKEKSFHYCVYRPF